MTPLDIPMITATAPITSQALIATGLIGSDQIADSAVATIDLAPGIISAGHIAPESIKRAQCAPNAKEHNLISNDHEVSI